MFVGVLCHANNDQVIKNTIMGTQRGEWWRFGSTQGIELVQAGALRPVWGVERPEYVLLKALDVEK